MVRELSREPLKEFYGIDSVIVNLVKDNPTQVSHTSSYSTKLILS